MRIVVVGATGLIGKKVMARLADHDVEVRGVSRELGVNAFTGAEVCV